MKKRFGFSIDQELHSALKAFAKDEGTSMASICREALSVYLKLAAERKNAPSAEPGLVCAESEDSYGEFVLPIPWPQKRPSIKRSTQRSTHGFHDRYWDELWA